MDVTSHIAARAYAAARPATEPGAARAGAGQKAEGLGRVAQDFAQTLQQGDRTAQAAMTGDADPYALVQALAATELAVETAVTVRDRVVEAYQEILRMPV
jgi:flagellar hook-basal body complex protein FliE